MIDVLADGTHVVKLLQNNGRSVYDYLTKGTAAKPRTETTQQKEEEEGEREAPEEPSSTTVSDEPMTNTCVRITGLPPLELSGGSGDYMDVAVAHIEGKRAPERRRESE